MSARSYDVILTVNSVTNFESKNVVNYLLREHGIIVKSGSEYSCEKVSIQVTLGNNKEAILTLKDAITDFYLL